MVRASETSPLLRLAAMTERSRNNDETRGRLPMDLFEPWVIRSALVVGALAAVNVWLFMLSINQPCEIPASSSPRQSHGQFPNPDTAQAAVAATDTSVGRSEERRVGKECRSRWAPDQ